MQKLGSKVVLATTHHPQTNGLTERMNRTLIGLIRKVCHGQQSKWVEALPLLEFAYNNSPHSITRVSPFKAVQGTDPIVPASLLLPIATGCPQLHTYADLTYSRLQTIWASIKESEEKQARQVQARENRKRGPEGRIQAGDEVLCRRFQLTGPEGKRKQELQYEGPFRVAKIVKDSVAELEGLPRGAPTMINVQYLRKYLRDKDTEALRAGSAPGEPISRTDGTEWEVEEIQDVRQTRGRKEYLLKWKGYDWPTWVASRDLTHCKELLAEFRQRQRRANPQVRRQA